MHEFQLAAFNEIFDVISVFLRGEREVVATEKTDVAQCVIVMVMLFELFEDRLEDLFDFLVIVFVICLEPSHIHVRMWHEMHLHIFYLSTYL